MPAILPAEHQDPAARYAAVRAQTEALAAPLSAEDCALQSMPDASPVKWHLAHTSWFFETFVLGGDTEGPAHFPHFRVLFNSYYVGVGERHPRPERGLLSRPSLEEVREYRTHVDGSMLALLRTPAWRERTALIELCLNHEQQHQELIRPGAGCRARQLFRSRCLRALGPVRGCRPRRNGRFRRRASRSRAFF